MMMKHWLISALLLAAAGPPAAGRPTDKYVVSFKVYPNGSLCWREENTLAKPTGQKSVEITAQELEQVTELPVWFSHDDFNNRRYLIKLSEVRGKDPDGDGHVLYPDEIRLKPKNLVIGLRYWIAYHVPQLLALALVTGFPLAFALRRQRQMRGLVNYNKRLDELARQARYADDPLVKDRKILGPYRIVDKLGEGGMATVYKALPSESLNENEAVAIKLMKAELTRPDDRKRFIREIEVVRKLSHPNIVRLEYYGETQHEELFMAMELVKGKPLDIPRRGLPLEKVNAYLLPILSALQYAHKQGVVHRDIKPANVLVSDDGQVKLMDFGLARTHDASRVTKTGTMMGSPAYVPPEQLTGAHPDPRADQYSLGATLFEMLTGRVPFDMDDTMAVLMAHMTQPAPALVPLKPDLPPSIERVVLRMLEKKPEARWQDLEEMGRAWQTAMQDPGAFSHWEPAPIRTGSSEREEPAMPTNVPLDGGDDTIC